MDAPQYVHIDVTSHYLTTYVPERFMTHITHYIRTPVFLFKLH